MSMVVSKKEFERFSIKYGVVDDIVTYGSEFATLKVNKERLINKEKEVLSNYIKKVTCKEHIKILYYHETEYQEDEYSTTSTPMTLTVYTEQECTDKKFLNDLESFIDKIIDIYNNKRKPTIDDILEIKATYVVDIPEWDVDDYITYYIYLFVDDVYEENGFVYITFGLF